jgi:hypothetical protein
MVQTETHFKLFIGQTSTRLPLPGGREVGFLQKADQALLVFIV